MDREKPFEHCAPNERPMVLILVIDDEPDTVTSLEMLLSLLGFGVVTARSAREALQRMDERLPDLIITDNAMPSMSGFELCQILRARDATRPIPIVMHTATDLSDERSQLYDRVVTKPADVDAFVKAIEALLPASITCSTRRST